MPIYEYKCRGCEVEFEELVKLGEVPDCPSCGGSDLDKLVSLPAVSTESSRKRTSAIARKATSEVRREQKHAQSVYERNYIRDHS